MFRETIELKNKNIIHHFKICDNVFISLNISYDMLNIISMELGFSEEHINSNVIIL